MKRPIRKRSYLLLEIVLSLFLISICLFPLIRPHLAIEKSRAKQIKEVSAYAPFQNAFCLLKENLYEQKISWKQLNAGHNGNFGPIHYEINKIDECNKPSLNGRGLLLQVKFTLDQLEHVRTLFIEEVAR